MKMMYKNFLMAASLSTTLAAGTRRVQESTLGEQFLAAAKNVTDSEPQMSWQRDGSINAEIASGDEMASLTSEIRESCNELGYVESENSYTDSFTGELQNVYLYCRFSTDEDYNVAMKAIMDSVNAANPTSMSTSTNVYSNGYTDIASQKAMQQGMEKLLQMADTIEQVMLIVPYWSNYITYYPSTHSINVNLNKAYSDPYFNSTYVPTGFLDDVSEEQIPEENEEVAEKKKKKVDEDF
jgi:hypothetical protein